MSMRGTVRYGISNRYTVESEGKLIECTLKGKQLSTDTDEYSALAPGDLVEFEVASELHGLGVVHQRLPRNGTFGRWNKKRNRVQVFAANIDQVVCVCSAAAPPFHPRFVDRVLVTADWYKLPAIVIMNKRDLGVADESFAYLSWLSQLGYRVKRCSASSGNGMRSIAKMLTGHRSVLVGQSGVGKSTILNSVVPELDLKVGEISKKYDRGVHTTRFGQLIDLPHGGWVVDVPGIREIELVPGAGNELDSHFWDIAALAGECRLPRCSHLHEPDCAVIEAAESGALPFQRYESYGMLRREVSDSPAPN